jgi:3D (Asp-Asp-Asp) domain-containing protein
VASACLVATIALAGLAVVPSDGGSQTAASLRRDGEALAARERSAVLELYGIESRLTAARVRLASLEARSQSVERRQREAARRLAIARRTVHQAERALSSRVRALYERGDPDPLAVVLGAQSLEDALTAIDGLELAAQQDRSIIGRASAARTRFARLARSLRARGAELGALVRAQRAETAALVRARAERAAYIDELAAERRLTDARLAQVEAAAAQARQRTLAVAAPAATPAAAAAPPVPAAPASGPRTLTVVASGYSLGGTTATGIAVGWGVVAVDPAVIPLGTRMTIPGYGSGVASDTGGAVRGAHIDLWFPSEAEAFAWGRRTVTITLD